MRKHRAELLDAFSHKRNGTPETHARAARVNQGALARLHASGALGDDQLRAAVEIAAIAERIGRDVSVRTASLETRIDSGRHGDEWAETLGRVRREVAYTAWRQSLGAQAAPVLDMIVGDAIGYSVAAARYRMHPRRAKALLLAALDAWPAHLRDATRAVGRFDLAWVHARLAA